MLIVLATLLYFQVNPSDPDANKATIYATDECAQRFKLTSGQTVGPEVRNALQECALMKRPKEW